MKNNLFIRFVVLFSILFTLTKCTSDSDLEILEEMNEIETVKTKSNNLENCDWELKIKFNYQPGATQAEKKIHRDAYYTSMSQYFTICERYFGIGCGKEKWIVNGDEYFDYLNAYPYGTGNDDGEEVEMKPGGCTWIIEGEQGPSPNGNGDTFDEEPEDEFLGW